LVYRNFAQMYDEEYDADLIWYYSLTKLAATQVKWATDMSAGKKR
jgi:hypothetical protein